MGGATAVAPSHGHRHLFSETNARSGTVSQVEHEAARSGPRNVDHHRVVGGAFGWSEQHIAMVSTCRLRVIRRSRSEHGTGHIAKVAAKHFNYEADYIEDKLDSKTNAAPKKKNPKPPSGGKPADWDAARQKADV